MTKTHAEFLEELKEFILEHYWKDEFGTEVIYKKMLIQKIEQFQAEVDNENSK
jgi:hypothetical protein